MLEGDSLGIGSGSSEILLEAGNGTGVGESQGVRCRLWCQTSQNYIVQLVPELRVAVFVCKSQESPRCGKGFKVMISLFSFTTSVHTPPPHLCS